MRRAGKGVRLLARGDLKAKLTIHVDGASKAAIEAVEKAGGFCRTAGRQTYRSEKVKSGQG